MGFKLEEMDLEIDIEMKSGRLVVCIGDGSGNNVIERRLESPKQEKTEAMVEFKYPEELKMEIMRLKAPLYATLVILDGLIRLSLRRLK